MEDLILTAGLHQSAIGNRLVAMMRQPATAAATMVDNETLVCLAS